MNRHELLDAASISLASLLLRDVKFFSNSRSSPPIGETAARARSSLETVRIGGVQDVTVETSAGTFRGAYRVDRWNGPEAPTVVYHHGSGEDPFATGRFASSSFQRLFESDDGLGGDLNLVAIRAPFHDRSSRAYARAMGDLSNFVGMLATSTAIFEDLRRTLGEWGCTPLVASGTSLGGWVVNLHRAFYGGFDRYVPLLAGAKPSATFTSSAYRRLVADDARADPEALADRLDFHREFAAVDAADCSPLLARYDRIVEFDVQRSAYEGMSVGVIEKGHVTGALASEALRSHVARAIEEAGGGRREEVDATKGP